jgi:alcohol dehydrogenase class IV
MDDIERGLSLFQRASRDLILAVGGGTAIDTAKLIAIVSAQTSSPLDIVLGREKIRTPGLPVMALPTTAGTGSEVTHFAVVYVDDHKHSLAHPTMRPAYAIVDPELTYSMPPEITTATGLDAFSQAVESMWSVHATDKSKTHSREAIRLALKHLPEAVHRPKPLCRHAMSRASHLAGRAIDVTRTTAPHAISYTMTSQFGVPHGLAVALTLGATLVYNSRVTDEDCQSQRGAEHVRRAIDEVGVLLGSRDAESSRQRITKLMESLEAPTRLRDVGIRTPADRELLVNNVNLERLANNPRKLTPEALAQIIESIA